MNLVNAQTDAVRRVLAERAAVLALQAEERDQRHGKELVVFCLGASLYAIAARWVRAVHPLRRPPAALPQPSAVGAP